MLLSKPVSIYWKKIKQNLWMNVGGIARLRFRQGPFTTVRVRDKPKENISIAVKMFDPQQPWDYDESFLPVNVPVFISV